MGQFDESSEAAEPAPSEQINHDRLFKELIRVFFVEFLELFYPEVLQYLDRDSIEFLDKEVFADTVSGEKLEADLVVKAKFRGRDAFFLVHLEAQSTAQADFETRMFRYFAALYLKHGLPVYPIAIFTYDKPMREEKTEHVVTFPDMEVLRFRYRALQLNRLNWRDFINRPNPIAAAWLAKMQIQPEDRVRAKIECLRMIATQKLNPARMELIWNFGEAYLRLTAQENRIVRQEIEQLEPTAKEQIMQVSNMWIEEGMEKGIEMGIARGWEAALLRILRRRFGAVGTALEERILRLNADQAMELMDLVVDAKSLDEARNWLDQKGV